MQRGMIINFMIPASIFIVVTTILGTLTLRAVSSKQRQVIVESIGNILEKCQNIDASITASINNLSENVPATRCCDEIERVSTPIGRVLGLDKNKSNVFIFCRRTTTI